MLASSLDQGLCCAVYTHGVSYLADLEPNMVMLTDHLLSLPLGFNSVHAELHRLEA